MFVRILVGLLLALLLVGCETKSNPAKARMKEQKGDDLLSDVARQPTYGHQAVRVLKGAREVQRDIKKEQKEREEIRQEAD
jgi:hypothetical protein